MTAISAPLLLQDMQEAKIRGFFCAQYQYKDPTTTGVQAAAAIASLKPKLDPAVAAAQRVYRHRDQS
jgi:hypothetical protein